MAKIDDLKVATDALNVTANLAVTKIDELKAAGNNIDPQLDAAIVAINEATDKLNAAIQ